MWTEIDEAKAAENPDPMMCLFTGKAAEISDDITGSVYIAGVPRMDEPYSSCRRIQLYVGAWT